MSYGAPMRPIGYYSGQPKGGEGYVPTAAYARYSAQQSTTKLA